MKKLTMENIVAGSVDVKSTTYAQLMEFIEGEGLELELGTKASKADILNAIADVLDPDSPEGSAVTSPVDLDPAAEVKDSKLPAFLARRAARIEGAVASGSMGVHGAVDRSGSGEMTAYQKRRLPAEGSQS